MDNSNDSSMEDVEETQETQQQTQSTQQASQQMGFDSYGHLWGYLQPCNGDLARIDFWKVNPRYRLGRNKELNDCVLPGAKVSNQHCVITWDGSYDSLNVVVQDNSSNGTFINGSKIGRGQTRALREGNEIAFGTCVPQHGSLEDYRFIYRHTASGPPTDGLYAFYDLIGELGRGSFAVVMKAVCRKTGEYVAVKMIQDSRSVRSPGEQSNHKRIKQEIKILESLEHPNICELKEVFFQQDSQDINLVLELIEGGDLLDYILQKGGLSEADSQHITYQLCDALAYIHSKNVTHRDLKPENVLLTKDSPPKVKVADFGLAKFVDSLTMLKTMCGTPSYLAPEVVAQPNNGGYDNLVDSWSVGVIVFSMLTNSSPFVEEERHDVRTRILQRTIDWSVLTSKEGVSAQAIDFVQRLLEIDPRQRMGLADSLQHPWLKSHIPVYGPAGNYVSNILTDDYSMVSSSLTNDGSFHGSVHEDFHNMHIELAPPAPGTFSNGSIANGLTSQPSRGVPLRRGSLAVLQAMENGTLSDPPVEMIVNAAAQDLRERQASKNTKGTNKRMHSELTPPPEAINDDVISGPSTVVDDKASNLNGETSMDFTPTTGRKGRGKGKPTSSSSPKKMSAQLTTTGAATPTRRSSRLQKAARRI
ncbi:hypothetical protein H2248_005208 [Termitomyces sp. 'cryptogamus']|nr:hypothetical protein H2248_005208 [Termitomyces sp. 'cryptogamus']